MGNTIDFNKKKVNLKKYSSSLPSQRHKKINSNKLNKSTTINTTKKHLKTNNSLPSIPSNKNSFVINNQEGLSNISTNLMNNQQQQNNLKININNHLKTTKPPQRRRSAVELLQAIWKQRQRRRDYRSVSSCSLLQVESHPNVIHADSLISLEASLKEPKSFDGLLRWGLLKVSVDTMAITALPLDCWLKERLKNWVQLSGHQGTIVPASNHSLWKKQPQGSHIESKAYSLIMLDPTLQGITPNFIREIQHRNEVFIEIQDLLAEFPDPSTRAIMDIKIGTRTFLESEVANRHKRVDLYRKMVELAPDEPTEEERQDEAITKLRYMQFRERKSSSATLGFRIEASQLPGVPIQKNFKQIRTRLQVRKALRDFCGSDNVCEQMAKRLRNIRDSVEKSSFFASHEVVGSSVLLIHNGINNNNNKQIKVGAWLIDFAKCHKIEGGKKLTHRLPWDLGNHEDGYLIGLDNLVELLEEENEEEENNNNNKIKNEEINKLKFNNENKFIEMLGNI